MKVAFMLGSLNRGGLETLLLDVCKSAKQEGLDCIGIHRKGGKYTDDFYDAIDMYQLSPYGCRYITYIIKLRKLLKQHNITAVHAQQELDALYALLATMGTNIKVVQTFHGYDYNKNFISKFLIWLTILFCNRNFFVSNSQREYYSKKYSLLPKNKLYVLYNGINFSKLSSLSKRDRYIQGKKLNFGTVGNFVPGREQSSLCRFLKILRDSGVDFDFSFVGARNEQEPWRFDDCVEYCRQNKLEDCVHFLGSRGDVPQLLSEWDAFVYSTDHDTFGIAVIEAIASGLPVFVNDWIVMKEITEDGALSTIYKTKDEKDLLEKFIVFLQNRDSYYDKAYQSAIIVREKFSIKSHIKQLQKYLLEISNK